MKTDKPLDYKKKVQTISIVALAVILVVVFTFIPFYNTLIEGIYSWHIKQPAFTQGGLVLILFIIATIVFMSIFKNNSFLIYICMCGVYLSNHGVIIPFTLAYLYFEVLCCIGNTIYSYKRNEVNINLTITLICGISVWGMFAIICSLLGFGGFNDLRILTLLLLIICLFISRKSSYKFLLFRFRNYVNENAVDFLSRLMLVLLSFFILALSAKSNSCFDYDSIWYGLRPEQVLIGERSFYDNLGFIAFVYYYPKLMELLYLPVSNLGDYSFIIIANIFVLIWIIIALYDVFKLLLPNKKYSFYTSIIIILTTSPAIAGIASTAKPDILGMFLVLSSWIFFLNFVKNSEKEMLVFSIISLILATGTKHTYLLWGGLIFICMCSFIGILCKQRKIHIKDILSQKKNIYFVFFSTLVFIIGIHYRTFKLTGYPIYPVFNQLFIKLGFVPKQFFYTTYKLKGEQFTITRLFERMYQVFFDPQHLSRIVMLWTTGLLPILCIISLCLLIISIRKTKKADSLIVFFMANLFFLLPTSVYYIVTLPNPDGNYFILPFLIVEIILIRFISNKLKCFNNENKSISIKLGYHISCVIILTTQIITMFVSHPSWKYGTQAFSMELLKNNYDTIQYIDDYTSYRKYSEIDRYIKENLSNDKIICNNSGGIIFSAGRVEYGNDLLWCDSSLLQKYENFATFIENSHTKAFVIFNSEESLLTTYIERFLSERSYKYRLEDEGAVLYVLNTNT